MNSKNSKPAPVLYHTHLILVRHGETDWNVEGRLQGHQDIPLNNQGIAQAQRVAEHLARAHKHVAAIYSSDLQRAIRTAQEIACRYNLEVTITPNLREIHHGTAEGLTLEQVETLYGPTRRMLDQRYQQLHERWNYTELPEAETPNQLLERVRSYLKTVTESHANQTVIIVTHARVIKSLIMQAGDLVTSVPNCSIAEFNCIAYDHSTRPLRLKFLGITCLSE
jgi:2,3-bisphosphoglycerate-dependent phosphoglycerate mutase